MSLMIFIYKKLIKRSFTMSKKISTIFLTLFLVGVLSVSCSNKDKTGAGETTKGIEQYNGNTYVSTETL